MIMANNEKNSQLKESERKLINRQKCKGNEKEEE